MEEWNAFKRETNTKLDYFIKSILKGGWSRMRSYFGIHNHTMYSNLRLL